MDGDNINVSNVSKTFRADVINIPIFKQYFVEDSVKERLELITIPDSWVTRWCSNDDVVGKDLTRWQFNITKKYKELTNNDYLYFGGQFHKDIKLVHFTNAINKPHEWLDYKNFV